ncbi:MAG: PilZ domain-containing protein [Pseudomonadota bacterium]
MSPKRVIKAKDFVKDLQGGMTTAELMEKYKLSAKTFQTVMKKLIEASTESLSDADGAVERVESPRVVEDMRQFPRKIIDFPLMVYGDLEQIEQGLVVDASEKGIRVRGIGAKVGESRTFIVRYRPGDKRQPFVFDATCRWTNGYDRDPQKTVAGFEITRISNVDAERLQDILV